jgi:hypothetical protein
MDSPRGLGGRLRAWRASVGSAIAGRPAGHFAAVASEPLVEEEERAPATRRATRADALYAAAGAAPPHDGSWSQAAPPRSYAAASSQAAAPPRIAAPGGAARLAPPRAPAPPAAEAELAQLSAAARTGAALGWDVCVAAASAAEREALLGDDLRAVAAQLRGCLAVAATQGGVRERALADAFEALDELGYARATGCEHTPARAGALVADALRRAARGRYVLDELERAPEAAAAPQYEPPRDAAATATPQGAPQPARAAPPPRPQDTEQPLIEL